MPSSEADAIACLECTQWSLGSDVEDNLIVAHVQYNCFVFEMRVLVHNTSQDKRWKAESYHKLLAFLTSAVKLASLAPENSSTFLPPMYT